MKLFLSLCLAATAIAAPPSLTEIAPRGAQQGKTLTVTLSGRDLAEGSKILSTLPAIFTPLTPTMKGLTYLLELKADAPPGVYPIRVQNPNKSYFRDVDTFSKQIYSNKTVKFSNSQLSDILSSFKGINF